MSLLSYFTAPGNLADQYYANTDTTKISVVKIQRGAAFLHVTKKILTTHLQTKK